MRFTKTILCLFLLSFLAFSASTVYAYRPFTSTNAAIVPDGNFLWEMDFLQIQHFNDQKNRVMSGGVWDYGINSNWQVTWGSDYEWTDDGRSKGSGDVHRGSLIAPFLSFAHILRQGYLQDADGPSVAINYGVDFSGGIEGRQHTGLNTALILSDHLGPVVFHLNGKIILDRAGYFPVQRYGIILEYPEKAPFRLVTELNTRIPTGATGQGTPQTYNLYGFIWTINGINFDFGYKFKLTEDGIPWRWTTGATFFFPKGD